MDSIQNLPQLPDAEDARSFMNDLPLVARRSLNIDKIEGTIYNPFYQDVLFKEDHHQHIRDALAALPPSELSKSFDETQLQRIPMLFARSDSRIAVEVGDCPSSEDMSALRIDQGHRTSFDESTRPNNLWFWLRICSTRHWVATAPPPRTCLL